MSPRRKTRHSSSRRVTRKTSNAGDSKKPDLENAASSSNLRLPLGTLQLLMRKCEVKLTRCDDMVQTNSSVVRREVHLEKPDVSSIKKEVIDHTVDLNRYQNHCSRNLKTEFQDLWTGKYDLLLPSILLTRCDDIQQKPKLKEEIEEVKKLKPIVVLEDIMKKTKPCQVTLFRCDATPKQRQVELSSPQPVPEHVSMLSTPKSARSNREKIVRRYPCELCDKSFASWSSMEYHLLRHLGELPYKCHECSKRFPRPWQLKAHSWTHSSEYSFHCQTCGKGFKHPSNLSSHKRVHTGGQTTPERKNHRRNADKTI